MQTFCHKCLLARSASTPWPVAGTISHQGCWIVDLDCWLSKEREQSLYWFLNPESALLWCWLFVNIRKFWRASPKSYLLTLLPPKQRHQELSDALKYLCSKVGNAFIIQKSQKLSVYIVEKLPSWSSDECMFLHMCGFPRGFSSALLTFWDG